MLAYDAILDGRATHGAYSTAYLLAEVYRLGWSSTYVAKAVRSIPRRHSSQYLSTIMILSKMLVLLESHSGIDELVELYYAAYRLHITDSQWALK